MITVRRHHLLPIVGLIFLSLLSVNGCMKKRSSRFAQGEGEHLFAVQEFQGKHYVLTTGNSRAPGIASDAEVLELVPDNKVLRSMNSVEFSVETEFGTLSQSTLTDFNFFGKENYQYQLETTLTENHLIFFKVAPLEDLPSDEITYAIEDKATGLYKVPLLGFPIEKFIIEKVEDPNGKKTKVEKPFPKDFLAEASHFKADTSAVEYFEKKAKLNLLPTSLFSEKSEWFFEISVVDGPLSTQLGQQINSGKVRFMRTSNSLMAVDVNIPEEAQRLSGEKLPKVIELPARWVNFQLVETGEKALLEEKLLVERDPGALEWSKRPLGLLDFRRVNNLDSANANNFRLKRLEVNDNYIGFIISNSQSGRALHYSFARDDSSVEGQPYPNLDRKRFGFWRHLKKFYPGQLTSSEKTIEESISLGRMYPKDGVIEVYLTDTTPSDPIFINAITEAIEAWDEAFAKAARGSERQDNPIRVKLNLDKRVQNGDVRYNKISFYNFDINVGRLLGYGPSVTDERNGRIFSSTNHIYLRTYREIVYRNLKDYIRYRLGLYDHSELEGISFPKQRLAVSGDPDNASDLESLTSQSYSFDGATRLVLNSFARDPQSQGDVIDISPQSYLRGDGLPNTFHDSFMRSKELLAMNEYDRSRSFIPSKLQKNLTDSLKKSQFGNMSSSCNYQAAIANTFDEIENQCGKESFGAFVDQLAAHPDQVDLSVLTFPKEVFEPCAMKLLGTTLRSTLVHEFGHNLGLTHNFKGSADDANFERDSQGIPLTRSTSVMDYPDADDDRATKPGTYDIAALRYGYYQTVELNEKDEEGRPLIQSIATDVPHDTRPIELRIPANTHMKPYKYCWDLDIADYEIPHDDPECRRWDRGSNPVQMAYSMIDHFNFDTASGLYRFENVMLNDPSDNIWARTILPLQSIYAKYRHLLYLKTKHLNDPYFVKNESNFANFIRTQVGDVTIDQLPKDPSKVEEFVESLTELQQYKLASDIIFKFLKEVAFSQDEYCLVWQGDQTSKTLFDAQPFFKIRNKIYTDTRASGLGVTVNSCSDAVPYLNLPEGAFVETRGNAYKNLPFSADEDDFNYSFEGASLDDIPYLTKDDIRKGFGLLRLYAFEALTGRFAPLLTTIVADFKPSMLDNPEYRKQISAEFEKRLVRGVDLTELGIEPEQFSGESNFITQYSEEFDLMINWYPMILANVSPPGENVPERIKDLVPDLYNRADFVRLFPNPSEAGIVYVRNSSGLYYVAENKDSIIYKMIYHFAQDSNILADNDYLPVFVANKDQIIAGVDRIQGDFFEALKTEVIDLNFIKLNIVEEAKNLLVPMYSLVDQQEPSNEDPENDQDQEPEPLAVGVRDLAIKALPYLDYAQAIGITITDKLINDILMDLAQAKDVQKNLSTVLSSVTTEADQEYIDLAIDVIIAKMIRGLDSRSEQDPLIIQSNYQSQLENLKANQKSEEILSEIKSKTNLLRQMIME